MSLIIGSFMTDVRWAFVEVCLKTLQDLKEALICASSDKERMLSVKQQQDVKARMSIYVNNLLVYNSLPKCCNSSWLWESCRICCQELGYRQKSDRTSYHSKMLKYIRKR